MEKVVDNIREVIEINATNLLQFHIPQKLRVSMESLTIDFESMSYVHFFHNFIDKYSFFEKKNNNFVKNLRVKKYFYFL